MLFDASSGASSFHHMNGYESKTMSFSFARSVSVREKRFNAAWKIYEAGSLYGELPKLSSRAHLRDSLRFQHECGHLTNMSLAISMGKALIRSRQSHRKY